MADALNATQKAPKISHTVPAPQLIRSPMQIDPGKIIPEALKKSRCDNPDMLVNNQDNYAYFSNN
jgi:hypothetical protein